MEKSVKEILFFNPQNQLAGGFVNFVKLNGFSVDQVRSVEEAQERLLSAKYHVIVSTESIDVKNGEHIYQLLEAELLAQAIPFFLILEDYQQEDIVVALELGIDNVLFPPFAEESTILKINKEVNKRLFLNFLDTTDFKIYFTNSHIPMILVENDHVKEMNSSFSRVWNESKLKGKPIVEVFDFPHSIENKLNQKRFDSDILNYCKLKNVSFKNVSSIKFDFLMFKAASNKRNSYLIELFPFPNSLMEVSYCKDNYAYPCNPKLTPRELEVLELSSNGLPIKLIADRLGVSNRTVEKHRSNIMEKLGVNNMIEAVSTVNVHFQQRTAL
jgi:DNA-binding CsgD family transcriptional regulator